jgi:Tfp pilus assembly protein PilO
MKTRLLWIILALVLVGGIGYQLHASSHRSVATETSSATGSSSSSVSSSSTNVTSVNGKTNIEITVS